jgi:hypothetical protein
MHIQISYLTFVIALDLNYYITCVTKATAFQTTAQPALVIFIIREKDNTWPFNFLFAFEYTDINIPS